MMSWKSVMCFIILSCLLANDFLSSSQRNKKFRAFIRESRWFEKIGLSLFVVKIGVFFQYLDDAYKSLLLNWATFILHHFSSVKRRFSFHLYFKFMSNINKTIPGMSGHKTDFFGLFGELKLKLCKSIFKAVLCCLIRRV